jgi:hypothetical protein
MVRALRIFDYSRQFLSCFAEFALVYCMYVQQRLSSRPYAALAGERSACLLALEPGA